MNGTCGKQEPPQPSQVVATWERGSSVPDLTSFFSRETMCLNFYVKYTFFHMLTSSLGLLKTVY